jgi:hypothetical protein
MTPEQFIARWKNNPLSERAGAHKMLHAAVAAAYGWTDYTPAMPDDEILLRLLALNLERATP